VEDVVFFKKLVTPVGDLPQDFNVASKFHFSGKESKEARRGRQV